MFDDLIQTLRAFLALFRQVPPLPRAVMLPGLVLAFLWPLARVALDNEATAFMLTFVLAMALRIAIRAEGTIRTMLATHSSRATVILALSGGPGLLGLLIWADDPLWCQRLLSLYFLMMAGICLVDVLAHGRFLPRFVTPATPVIRPEPMRSRVLAINYVAMLLLNETLIAHSSASFWLMFFAALPYLSQRIMTALLRTVDLAEASGLGGR